MCVIVPFLKILAANLHTHTVHIMLSAFSFRSEVRGGMCIDYFYSEIAQVRIPVPLCRPAVSQGDNVCKKGADVTVLKVLGIP